MVKSFSKLWHTGYSNSEDVVQIYETALSNLMRLVLTGAWLDVAYFEIELLYFLNIRYILTMRTSLTHTLYSQPNLIWEGNRALLGDVILG